MRDILFRGKRIDNNEWIYGNLLVIEDECFIITVSRKDWKKIQLEKIEVNPDTVGQYTGLKDKNGTKIFEGDIVKYHTESISFKRDTIGVVEYYNGTFGIVTDKGKHFLSFHNMSAYVRCIEVIGNIYDNPELLEVEDAKNS